MLNFLINIFFATIFTASIDSIYLKFIALDFFKEVLGSQLKSNIDLFSGFIVWFLIALGSYFFVYRHYKIISDVILYGAIFGFILYGVYELTNYAIFRSWTLKLVLIDLIWGVILNIIVALYWHFVGGIFLK